VIEWLSAHMDRVAPLLGPGSEDEMLRRFFARGDDPRLPAMMDAFAHRHAPAMTRAALDKAESVVRYRATVRAQRVPEVDRWIAAQAPAGASRPD
jgi:aminopeptidase N